MPHKVRAFGRRTFYRTKRALARVRTHSKSGLCVRVCACALACAECVPLLFAAAGSQILCVCVVHSSASACERASVMYVTLKSMFTAHCCAHDRVRACACVRVCLCARSVCVCVCAFDGLELDYCNISARFREHSLMTAEAIGATVREARITHSIRFHKSRHGRALRRV